MTADRSLTRLHAHEMAASLRELGEIVSPGLVETLGSLEAALPDGVLLRQVQLSRAGSLGIEGASKTLGGGEQFRKRLAGAGSRWGLSLESLGYDQARGEYAFRLKGAWGAR